MSDWLPVQIDAIPAELRALGCVLWRAESRGQGKPTKVPYCVADPTRRASSTDPSTWAPFDDACEAYAALSDVAGIGVVLTIAAGVSCIDLDRVRAGGALGVPAEAIVKRIDSWTEISPSGTGLHIFVLGTMPAAIKGEQIEILLDGPLHRCDRPPLAGNAPRRAKCPALSRFPLREGARG
jgi:putative DNA primase/helicase